jgi:hypothetical protein
MKKKFVTAAEMFAEFSVLQILMDTAGMQSTGIKPGSALKQIQAQYDKLRHGVLTTRGKGKLVVEIEMFPGPENSCAFSVDASKLKLPKVKSKTEMFVSRDKKKISLNDPDQVTFGDEDVDTEKRLAEMDNALQFKKKEAMV